MVLRAFPRLQKRFHIWEHDVNNSELVEKIAETTSLSKADTRKIVDGVFAAIADAAASGNEVAINGFGKFKVKDSPARDGRNPATGDKIQIAAARKLAFTPAKALKDKLNG